MADICIVYAREDASGLPAVLERLLSPPWSVWWDQKIIQGDYRREIVGEITKAGCLVPIWSRAAEFSPTLFDEVMRARKLEVPVLPIRIHEVAPPLGYGPLQTTDILDWNGDIERPELKDHVLRIEAALAARRRPKSRPETLGLGAATRLPLFFFSVSSHETQLQPGPALKALQVFDAKSILVSAYDLAKGRRTKTLVRDIERRRRAGGVILLDSGNYEKTRRDDKQWTHKTFREALDATPHDMAFCFDALNPPADLDGIVRGVVKAVERDAKLTDAPMLPIVHLPRLSNGDYLLDNAPAAIRRIAEALNPPMIAIPERELGPGVFARAATMRRIRIALQDLYTYQPIHVLGTGNPITIALLAAAGADSFDGLEWCRYVVDGPTSTLHHFQHYELFRWQDNLVGVSEVTRAAVNDPAIQHAGKAVLHNLDFYTSWLEKLRAAVQSDRKLVAFMTKLLPGDTMDQARAVLPDVLE